MRTKVLVAAFVCSGCMCFSMTTVDPVHPYAYAENAGWVNAYADGTNGVVLGRAFCRGYLYGENFGWIHLGDGSPENRMAYANDETGDYGVNHDGCGNLSGYAYGANIGWVSFEQVFGKPCIDLMTGSVGGYAWVANMGWINLATDTSFVRTRWLDQGPDEDLDGLPDAWEYACTNSLHALSNGMADADGDGMTDVDEYNADTDPLNGEDYLMILDFVASASTNWVTWPVKETREYSLQHVGALSNGLDWIEASSPFVPPVTTEVTERMVEVEDEVRFYRVEVKLPLVP